MTSPSSRKASRRTFVKGTSAATATVASGFPLIGKAKSSAVVLKFATLAPRGSTWFKALSQVGREVKEKTDGGVEMKFYGGGAMGDEPAMVRKMRTGQLDGAAVTNVGLGAINKQVLMLQLPMLFRNYDELDRVRDSMSDKFEALLRAEGFIMDGNWGDVGFTYLFSNSPIKVPSDVKGTKMWVWDNDPISNEVMKVTGVNAIPLAVPDVMASLQTGMIDAFLNSPYGAIALQWYTKAQYITNLKLAMTIGGTVMSQAGFDKLNDGQKEILHSVSLAKHKALLKRIRSDNKKAMKALVDKGITVVAPEDPGEWMRVSNTVRKNLTGSVFDKALIEEMMGLLGR